MTRRGIFSPMIFITYRLRSGLTGRLSWGIIRQCCCRTGSGLKSTGTGDIQILIPEMKGAETAAGWRVSVWKTAGNIMCRGSSERGKCKLLKLIFPYFYYLYLQIDKDLL